MTAPLPDNRLTRVRAVARLLDSAVGVPGTRFRFGLDAVIGLIPGLGDLTSALLSGYIVLTGIQLGAPRVVVIRMLGNIAIDTIVGAFPVLGDLFDAVWKSNNRNVALLEQYVDRSAETHAASRTMVIGAVIVLLVLLAVSAVLAVVLIKAVIALFQTL